MERCAANQSLLIYLPKLIFLTLLLVVSGCGSESSGSDARYDKLLNDIVAKDIPGVVLSVRRDGSSSFVGSAGLQQVEINSAMCSCSLFRIASLSKAFIGALSAVLHVKNRLNLDEQAARYLPEDLVTKIANLDRVTIRQLLNHTSGIAEYFDEEFAAAVESHPIRTWSALEALAFAYHKRPLSRPGEGFAYSNTNYLLAGLVLDEVLGYDHARALREEILHPLNLRSTYYENHEVTPPLAIVNGYHLTERTLLNVTDINTGYGLPDGGLLSTVEDVSHFFTSVVKDKNFPSAHLHALFLQNFLPENDGYGLGIIAEDSSVGRVYGHAGEIPGYSSDVKVFADIPTTIVRFANFTEDVSTAFEGGTALEQFDASVLSEAVPD